ncbi:hypothetical protein K3495_g11502 [Podosphaera aphanis]|nr:hypothetical protein K3495_g11502 [Podosphaera aphanis]
MKQTMIEVNKTTLSRLRMVIAARENEISSRLDEANILPENERRSRKAPRRQIYALARNCEAFHLAMAVTVSNPVIIGRKLPLVSTMKPPPSTWKQMIRHSESDGFKKAAKIEWNTLIEKDTLEMISVDEACQLEQEHQIKSLALKWVFTYKQDNEGRLMKYKARICVRGDLYRSTRDTFAATLAVSTFRALVSLMAAFDMEIISLDAVNAFLNSKLDEVVVCNLPPGYEVEGKKILLKRALYGLPRSPLLWAQTVERELENFGFHKIPGVDCLMFDGIIYCFYFVDDFLAISLPQHKEKLENFKKDLMNSFQMRECERDRFLGIRILRDRTERKVWILQDVYLANMGAKYNLDLITKTSTPLPTTYGKLTVSHDRSSDNTAAVDIATEVDKIATKLRHTDVHQNWLRQKTNRLWLDIRYIPTADMPADGLTKILCPQKHLNFLKQLNLEDAKHLIYTESNT